MLPVAWSGHSVDFAAGFSYGSSLLYSRVAATVQQAFVQEAGTGQALVYALYNDNTIREVSKHVTLATLAPGSFNVSKNADDTFDVLVRLVQVANVL